MGRVETRLDEVLALGLGDEGLELGSGECVHETGLGDDKEQHLGAGESGEFIRLYDAKRGTRADTRKEDKDGGRMHVQNGYAPSS